MERTAIVTGASSGIGLALVSELIDRGWNVAAVSRDTDKLAKATEKLGPNVRVCPADISDRKSVDAMMSKVTEEFGGLDLLVANAGLFSNVDFVDVEPATIESVIGVNLIGAMHCAQAAIPLMKRQKSGDIHFIGSIAGVTSLPNEAVYSPAKFGLRSFAHILRRQLRNDGIRVALISPGTVATPLWGEWDPDDVASKVDAGEILTAEDIAAASLFILDQPRHVAIRDLVILPSNQDV
ncbi:MAG: SDR family oxidoreductase [Hyphomicrobiales bacterium]